MKCPVCESQMALNIYRSYEPGQLYSEEQHVCRCGYEEITASDNYHSVTVEGVEYVCGDPTTIAGSKTAWDVWFAILLAREALSNGDIHNE